MAGEFGLSVFLDGEFIRTIYTSSITLILKVATLHCRTLLLNMLWIEVVLNVIVDSLILFCSVFNTSWLNSSSYSTLTVGQSLMQTPRERGEFWF